MLDVDYTEWNENTTLCLRQDANGTYHTQLLASGQKQSIN